MRTVFAVLLLYGIGTFSYAQVTLRGQVLDSATSQPLGLSFLKIANQDLVSDTKGNFEITDIPVGDYTLHVSHVGCKIKRVHIDIQKDSFIIVYLPHHDHTFEEVVAYGHQGNREPNARRIQIVSGKKLEQLAAVSLSDALQNTNGVRFLKTGTTIAKPIINGMHSNRISVINEDSKQEGQQWGSEHAPEIDPLSAGSIEVIKGSSTLRYGGDAMGGVIRVLPAIFDDSSYTKISLLTKGETNPNGGQLGVKIENNTQKIGLGQRLVVNLKRNGDATAASYALSNTGFSQLSGSYYAHYRHGKNELALTATAFVQELGILAASHIGNLTDLNRALASDTPLITRPFTYTIKQPSQLIQHYSGKLKWHYNSDHLGPVTLSYTIQKNLRQEFDNHNRNKDAALDLNLTTQQLNVLTDKHINQWRLQYGAQGEQQQNIFQGRYFIPNYQRHKTGIFSILTIEQDHYLLEGGVRYDWQNTNTFRFVKDLVINEVFTFDGISANLSGWRRINEDLKLHLSVATRFRSPDINELFSNGLHHGSAALEFGDLSLKQERSYSLNAAFNYNHNRLQVQVEPYFHYFQNYIYLQPSGEIQLSIRGAFPVFRYIQTNARYIGTDIDISYRITSNFTAETQAALLYVKDLVSDKYIFGIPAQRVSGQLKYTFAEALSLRDGYLWIGPSYTARQNRVELDQDFVKPPDAYFLLDAEFGAQYSDTPLHFSVGVNNALNNSYRDYTNRYRYFANDLGINFYITINYTF